MDRPRRDARRPLYLNDYVCEDDDRHPDQGAQSQEPRPSTPPVDARAVLESQATGLKAKLLRNGEKAVFLIDNWGSRTLLKAIERRLESTSREIGDVCGQLRMMGDADYFTNMERWKENCQEYVEEISDNIIQHLEAREGEQASEYRGSVHTDKLSGVNVMQWLKASCRRGLEAALAGP